LWNPFQNCGQAFLGNITVAQLYPPYIIALALGGRYTLFVITFIHLVIAGLSAYLLGRELGARPAAALCGAIASALVTVPMEPAVGQPYASGAYVWLPAAMLFCERTLRERSARNVFGMALSLAFALLAGFPQMVFYSCQLIALRALWEIARPGR